ncbi:MAG: hypothetical protein JO154_01635 [Chitinophaga sp.]|uniref:hypothetical protein n=1 Tax=Chitinophaga sp. TaxID=1869181 RepID=UPI0025BBDCDB|nr:hypothetical protein [Chitinophaga sp.]MBV8251280.1 hypothetical protein [Chitinophaga sp.]
MRYLLSLSLILCICTFAFAQRPIAAAELSFAAMARDSCRSAFLHFLDSAAVSFSKGIIRNVHPQWLQLPEPQIQLFGKAVYHNMALSGNTEFTTSPSEGKATSATPSTSSNSIANKSAVPSAIGEISEVESLFLKDYQTAGNLAFSEYITNATWFNLEGYPPLHDSTSIMEAIGELHNNITFKPVAGGLSEDKDLGYVYGYTLEGAKRNNYMRIWFRTSAGWKIILQIIQW